MNRTIWAVLWISVLAGTASAQEGQAPPGKVLITRSGQVILMWKGATVLDMQLIGYGPEWLYMDRRAPKEVRHEPDGSACAMRGTLTRADLSVEFAQEVKKTDDGLWLEVRVRSDSRPRVMGMALHTFFDTGALRTGTLRLAPRRGAARTLRLTARSQGLDERSYATTWELRIPGGPTVEASWQLRSTAWLESYRGGLRHRIWIVTRQVPDEFASLTVELKLPLDQFEVDLDPAASVLNFIGEDWFEWTPSWTDSPVDVSFLNEKPAGRHGFLRADRDQFVFEDGTPAWFWGLSLSNRGSFVPKEQAPAVARRIARLGFNIVRLHHLDAPWCKPPTGLVDYSKGNSRDIAPEGLDRLDYLIHCLKKEGVYVHLDMLVRRKFMEGDGVENAGQMVQFGKGYSLFVPRMIELQKEYMRALWTHKNPYTGLAYRDDPAIALACITNENDDTTRHFIHEREVQPYYNAYLGMCAAYARQHGHELAEVIGDSGTEASRRFTNEWMAVYFQEMHSYLRGLGVRVPISGTNWVKRSCDLPCMATMDFMDNHVYGGTSLRASPFDTDRTLWSRLANARVIGKPLVVTEYNEKLEVQERARMPLAMAAISALQAWNAPMCFSYCGEATGPDRIRALEFGIDPAVVTLMPAAALIYRRHDVAPARHTIVVRLKDRHLYGDDVMTFKDRVPMAYLTGVEQYRIVQALREKPFVLANMRVVGPWDSLLAPGATEVVSDTGQIRRRWDPGIQTIDAPRSQVAQGRLGELGSVILSGMVVECRMRFAVVAASSMTRLPVASSPEVLLTAVARAQNTGMRWEAGSRRLLDAGGPPVMVEPVEATVRLKRPRGKTTVRPLRLDGSEGPPLEVAVDGDGTCRFTIGGAHRTLYYSIITERAPPE